MPAFLKKKENIQIGKSTPAWMMTYSDLITQLLIFFVMLFALASAMDEGQLIRLKRKLQRYMEFQHLENVVGLDITEKGLIISFREKIMFDSGKADIYPEAKQILADISYYLVPAPNDIAIEGHTDNVPISSGLQSRFATNWELSTARATNVTRYLIEGVRTSLAPALMVAGYRTIGDMVDSNVEEVKEITGLSYAHADYIISLAKTIAFAAGRIRKRKTDEWERIPNWTRFIDTTGMESVDPDELLKRSVSLIREFGFYSERLSSAGYGEFHPVAGSVEIQTVEQRERNRRVDIVVKRIGTKIAVSSLAKVRKKR